MAARYLVPALAVAGRAVAQCSVSATTTIQNQGDASALATCTTFSGSIALATDAAGTIALDGIQSITGSLVANNATGLVGLSGDSLAGIGASFTLTDLTLLSTLNFPMLSTAKAIEWTVLNALSGLTFTTGVQMADTLTIQDTKLQTLEGINLAMVTDVTITENGFLNDITMQLGNISGTMEIGANGQNVSASFPNLKWANTMNLANLSSINMPSLASTNATLGFYSNFFNNIYAPNLTTVGGDLNIVGNAALVNISMPELTMITQALLVANNTALMEVNSLNQLETVGGAAHFFGNFTEVVLPSLKAIRGAFTLLSSSDITANCTTFENESGPTNVIQGQFNCNGSDPTAATDGGNSTGTSSGGDSATSSSAANAMVITGASGLLGVVAAIFGLL